MTFHLGVYGLFYFWQRGLHNTGPSQELRVFKCDSQKDKQVVIPPPGEVSWQGLQQV